MISDIDRYHGAVLRQLLVDFGRPLELGVADFAGRIDAFSVHGAAVQIKHSSKRLSPWRFTYMPENLSELIFLESRYDPVWVALVCGEDGIVTLSCRELRAIVDIDARAAAWVRVDRDRNSMYRVRGTLGGLPKAKPRGLEPFLTGVFGAMVEVPSE